ncbi:MAG: DMT family transporter [Firmicutes bacterium]|nr:DMT family transporter [Bacillota bacterium]
MTSNNISKQNILQKPPVLMLLALMCCLLWGSAFPFIKIGYSLLSIDSSDTASQILFAGIRFFSAGILTIIAGSILQKKPLIPSAVSWRKIIPLGMVQTVAQYVFFYIGLARTDGTRASIINGTNVFFALLISCFVFKYEKFTRQKLIGCIVGFVGIVVINISGKSMSGGSVSGDMCIIISVIAYALSSSMIKHYSKSENPVMLSGWQFAFGGAVMTAAALLLGGSIKFDSVKSLAVITELALVSAGAYTLWGLLLKYNDVSKVAIFGCLTPIFGFIMSALMLDEISALSWQSLSALALVCLGILTVNRMENNK